MDVVFASCPHFRTNNKNQKFGVHLQAATTTVDDEADAESIGSRETYFLKLLNCTFVDSTALVDKMTWGVC